jgi:hypothetical protein
MKVAEQLILTIKEWNTTKPSMPMLIYFNPDDVKKQAVVSTSRFVQGTCGLLAYEISKPAHWYDTKGGHY